MGMITSFQQEALKRDLNQLSRWEEQTLKDVPEDWCQDLIVNEAFALIEHSIKFLRDKLENKTGAC